MVEFHFRPACQLVVIDALDECDGDEDIRSILDLPTIRLTVFVTSRPETPIREGFRDIEGALHRDNVLQNVPRKIVDHDIEV